VSDSTHAPLPLPENPSLEWLRKHAKRRLHELREADPAARLADAQLEVARQYGFPSWRALKAHIDGPGVEGRLVEAAKTGDVAALAALLDEDPERLRHRAPPYGWTLLHAAAFAGQLAAVDLLIARGLDVDAREDGDRTYPMHWAAAAGHVEVVQRLIDAGGDVIGRGDDHQLEVIGWATCWEGCDDAGHRDVVERLLRHGARHHIFSAIAMNLGDEVRRIVADDPAQLHRRMSRNESHRLPLHHAVHMNRPEMVALLIELGADPLAVDHDGQPAAVHAMRPGVDRAVMETIRTLTTAELDSAERGHRPPRTGTMDLVAILSLGEWGIAEQWLRAEPGLLDPAGPNHGALHLMAKRGDVAAVRWLLAHGADPDARWAHGDAMVTALHLAALAGHTEVARTLLDAGADPTIRDSKHDSDALGWATFFRRDQIVAILESHAR
jgi:ankyrin repeat protein